MCLGLNMHLIYMYVCIYIRYSARYSARRSLLGATISALGGIDVSPS